MMHTLLVSAHVAGALALGAAIVGGLVLHARVRRAPSLALLGDALRRAEMLQQRLLGPGVLVLLASGIALVVGYYGGWGFLGVPWLAGMVVLFAIEGVRANTLSRRHAVRLGRLVAEAHPSGRLTPEIDRLRLHGMASFARFLELNAFLLIVALGIWRPQTWTMFWAGSIVAVLAAAIAAYVATPEQSLPSFFSRASVAGDGRD